MCSKVVFYFLHPSRLWSEHLGSNNLEYLCMAGVHKFQKEMFIFQNKVTGTRLRRNKCLGNTFLDLDDFYFYSLPCNVDFVRVLSILLCQTREKLSKS